MGLFDKERWRKKFVELAVVAKLWLKDHFTVRSMVGFALFIYAFIPDTAGRLSYWQELYHSWSPVLSKVYAFSLSGYGKVLAGIAGMGILFFDQRRLAERANTSIPVVAFPVTKTPEEERPREKAYEESMVMENCWTEATSYSNGSIGRFKPGSSHEIIVVEFVNECCKHQPMDSLTAKLTFYDSKQKPYCSLDGIWLKEESSNIRLPMFGSAKLIFAVSDGSKVFYTGGPLLNDKTELKKGSGFATIRLTYSAKGYISVTQKFYFSTKFGSKNEASSMSASEFSVSG